jgi:hypothetical protein
MQVMRVCMAFYLKTPRLEGSQGGSGDVISNEFGNADFIPADDPNWNALAALHQPR